MVGEKRGDRRVRLGKFPEVSGAVIGAECGSRVVVPTAGEIRVGGR